MFKIVNIMSFVATLLKTAAESFKQLIPAYNEFKAANEKAIFWEEQDLKKGVKNA